MDIGDIGSMIGNAASGGLLGLGGAIAGQVVGYFKDKQAAADQRAAKTIDYGHEKEMAQINAGNAAQAAAAQLDLTKVQGDIDGLKAALADQTTLSGRTSQWVTDVLALFRPGLTTLLASATGIGFVTLVLKSPPGAGVLQHSFDAIAGLTGMAVAWWFGARDVQKR